MAKKGKSGTEAVIRMDGYPLIKTNSGNSNQRMGNTSVRAGLLNLKIFITSLYRTGCDVQTLFDAKQKGRQAAANMPSCVFVPRQVMKRGHIKDIPGK